MIKQNELELTNIDLEIAKQWGNFFCFTKPSTACISCTNQAVFKGLLPNVALTQKVRKLKKKERKKERKENVVCDFRLILLGCITKVYLGSQ